MMILTLKRSLIKLYMPLLFHCRLKTIHKIHKSGTLIRKMREKGVLTLRSRRRPHQTTQGGINKISRNPTRTYIKHLC
jgi:hypothetical protein